jgi:hypothetical protein
MDKKGSKVAVLGHGSPPMILKDLIGNYCVLVKDKIVIIADLTDNPPVIKIDPDNNK